VANFVETEQIILFNNYLCSHVQIRGSVPVFFQQRGIKANITIVRTKELTNESFIKHMTGIKDTYNKCLLVNLLAKENNEEH